MEVDLSDHEIEALGMKLLLDSKDFIKRAGLFGVSNFEVEGHKFDLRFFDIFREASGGAIDTDLDLSAQGQALGVLQFIEDSSSDIFDEALELDGLTLLTEVGAAFVMRVGGKEGTVCREDVEGEKA
jgi:hypothetical protein